MKLKHATYILVPALSMILASEAGAISSKWPFQEIDAEKGGGTADPMIAAHLMGAWGMAKDLATANEIMNHAKNEFAQSNMYLICSANSGNSSWPGGCSPQGVVFATTQYFAAWGQKWSLKSFAASKLNLALSNQVDAMNGYKSPIVAPLYGHVDHWIAIRDMDVDLNVYPKVIKHIKYFDSGPAPELDQQNKPYLFALQDMSGDNWKFSYYKIIPDDALDASDPNLYKYIFSFDPPAGARLPETATPYVFARGVPVVDEGEMTEELAPVLVWDALEAQGLLTDPDYEPLAYATPGDAWTVRGRRPSGERWDYIVVPMYTEDMRALVGLVSLAASDGAYEMLEVYGQPRALELPDEPEARRRAAQLLGPDESLAGGALVWDAACRADHCRNPLLPYREFTVTSRGGERGRITVPMDRAAFRR